jgi:predicted 3-demethylubiquinone-9 3-methyltransferase (glyoxalase superfamily)
MCGWLKDRYGMRWQIVPRSFVEMMMDRDTEKSKRAMAARMQLVKLDVVKLKEAYAEPIGSGLAAKR